MLATSRHSEKADLWKGWNKHPGSERKLKSHTAASSNITDWEYDYIHTVCHSHQIWWTINSTTWSYWLRISLPTSICKVNISRSRLPSKSHNNRFIIVHVYKFKNSATAFLNNPVADTQTSSWQAKTQKHISTSVQAVTFVEIVNLAITKNAVDSTEICSSLSA